ncbi:MAG: hypothetical protein APF80_12605 [Alphaproteobacteria bacterium BRH_c36]|nr:MAG: hypothetical protein APF80_12605 [Alphaproteobacteria bacterium BRH_c36]
MIAFPKIAISPLLLPFSLLVFILTGCSQSPLPDDEKTPARSHPVARVVVPAEALQGAVIATVDPATMVEQEIEEIVTSESRCEFRYTAAGRPVLAVAVSPKGDAERGVLKLNGNLIALDPQPSKPAGDRLPQLASLSAGPMTAVVRMADKSATTVREGVQRRTAHMVFEIGTDLQVGYRGYYDCGNALQDIAYRH